MDEYDRTRVMSLTQRRSDRVDGHDRSGWRDERVVPGQPEHDEHAWRLSAILSEREQAGSGNYGRVHGGGPKGNDGRLHVRPLWSVSGCS